MKYSNEWEIVKDGNVFIDRLKVPGGWLVETMYLDLNCLAMCFLPDPKWEWDVEVIPRPKIT